MERKFKTGDKVRLVSDSRENAPMTVRGYVNDLDKDDPRSIFIPGEGKKSLENYVRCDWKDKLDKPQSKDFHEDQLEKI